uniref:tissue factor pathway inhibitor a isoform X2 n=1 Tax=Doryrhamphus excisus TaxID=161450 RepID=UPI0025AE80BC|nr:tissue factor pathway inhibitor a isoform X2 [Doryrhamphus excisus]
MFLSNECCVLSVFWLPCLFGTFGKAKQEEGPLPELFIFKELCALKQDPGPCRAIRDKYFFNVDTGQCELFEYGGCGGNANNFETLEMCEETCIVSEKVEVPLQTSSRDISDVQPTILTDEPTANNAVVQMNDTDPSPSTDSHPPGLCFSPVDSGACLSQERRFAYNPKTKRCHVFHYSGCGGNNNNFKHRRQCVKKCIKIRKDRGMKMIRMSKENFHNILNSST